MRLIGSRLILISVLFLAGALSVSATPTEQAVIDRLVETYAMDTSEYVIEVLANRLKATEIDPAGLSLRPLTKKEPLGLFSVAARIEQDGRTVESGQVRFRITRFATVLVAVDRIRRNEMLTGENLALQRVDVTSLKEKPFAAISAVVGLRSTRTLRQGTILTGSSAELPPDIEAGTAVSIVYTDGLCRITAPGTALQPGLAGDYVKVKNTSSGKIIVARVVDQNAVAVDP